MYNYERTKDGDYGDYPQHGDGTGWTYWSRYRGLECSNLTFGLCFLRPFGESPLSTSRCTQKGGHPDGKKVGVEDQVAKAIAIASQVRARVLRVRPIA